MKKMFLVNLYLVFKAFSTVILLSSCDSAIMGAGSSFGIAAFEERTIKTLSQDLTIATKIRLNLINAEKDFIIKVGIEVFDSRVLMTGTLENETLAAQAISLAWKVKGVKDVLNEIQVKKLNIRDLAIDSWITAQLVSKITLDKDIFAINYKIKTVNRIIYLIGVAQTKAELNKVLLQAKNIGSVKQVINHVQIK